MKLLLCVTNLKDIQPMLGSFSVAPQPDAAIKYLSSVKILQHEVDILETGVGVYQTAYKVTRALARQKYHLALKVSLGNAYKPETAIGTVLNIVNEKPGDYGMMVDGQWKDQYDFNLIDRDAEPHVRGGLVNMSNAYMNVFLPIKKVVGLSVNNYGDASLVAMRREKYKADCETGDGVGFAYPCLYEKQGFYHICVVERNLATGEENFNLAIEKMNAALADILQKI
ncbi:MAG TPA: hypothetical protein VK174_13155 [Chitinophagales bacterium]|nr:hypothetical protein [Chitinophagales bacterium]